jgi:hypothetical protein
MENSKSSEKKTRDLKTAFGMVGISLNLYTIELILATLEKYNELGENLTLKDTCEILEILNKKYDNLKFTEI